MSDTLKQPSSQTEVSVVIPCLNEVETIAECVERALQGIRNANVAGEVIVADNGSTDGSQDVAMKAGARLVPVAASGYGNALMGGIAAANGRWIIMGDADMSYDFLSIPAFVDELGKGYDLVQGCRLPAGGGRIVPGAMPWSHRWIGNPLFSLLARWWFRSPIHDIYCGLRAFRKEWQSALAQRCTGMEFATEMIIKASITHARVTEVPITLYPDKRTAHSPHLRTIRDGWRTLRFFLMYSPRWLFLIPGLLLGLFGVAGYALALSGTIIAGIKFEAHTLLAASLFILLGYQLVLFSIIVQTFAVNEGLLPGDSRFYRFFRIINLERGLAIGLFAALAGFALLFTVFNQWRLSGFGALEYSRTMRWFVPGTTLTALGFQTFFSSFAVSILGMNRK